MSIRGGGVGFVVLLALAGGLAYGATKKEFMTADESLVLQEFKGQPIIKKGDPKRGREFYAFYCTPCHGMQGRGDGQLADKLETLGTRPRNHVDGVGKKPGDGMNDRTDEQLFNAIKTGGRGIKKSIQMPAWGVFISDENIWNLVSYLRTIAEPKYVPK